MITALIFLLPLVCVIVVSFSREWAGLIAAVILVIYGLVFSCLLLLGDNRTVAGNAGLVIFIPLVFVALLIALRRGFFLFEGRKRRKSGFDSLMRDYGR